MQWLHVSERSFVEGEHPPRAEALRKHNQRRVREADGQISVLTDKLERQPANSLPIQLLRFTGERPF